SAQTCAASRALLRDLCDCASARCRCLACRLASFEPTTLYLCPRGGSHLASLPAYCALGTCAPRTSSVVGFLLDRLPGWGETSPRRAPPRCAWPAGARPRGAPTRGAGGHGRSVSCGDQRWSERVPVRVALRPWQRCGCDTPGGRRPPVPTQRHP